ncbi:SGNH/GDSL hydrolase family protein [Demequina aurantiaca]|uniref:SGNH/GDSL hydrolase family protein n=1 Tax=Demequina aurantiaca TaxID=676200 RepID=UPI000784B15E|nr:SGNH/GDSL hydrolase family protein [Demequina aurantiaca]
MRYVAIGDSFTEGVGDAVGNDAVRGWADLVAVGLATAGQDVWYSNLAIRGRLIQEIVDTQLEPALALDPAPDLMTFNGGGNDMLRTGFSVDRVMGLAERVVERCAETGTRLVILSGGDPTEGLPRGKTIRARGNDFMNFTRDMLARHPEVAFVDNFSDEELRDGAYWAADRLHLNALGHARVAARVLTALGVETPLPRADDAVVAKRDILTEAKYVGAFVLPWIARRITRTSSGDGRQPKYADWVRIDAATSSAKSTNVTE